MGGSHGLGVLIVVLVVSLFVTWPRASLLVRPSSVSLSAAPKTGDADARGSGDAGRVEDDDVVWRTFLGDCDEGAARSEDGERHSTARGTAAPHRSQRRRSLSQYASLEASLQPEPLTWLSPWPIRGIRSPMALRSLIFERFSKGVGPHRLFRLDHSRFDMRCPSTLCRALESFRLRETSNDVNYDIYWAVFDKNRKRIRSLAHRVRFKKIIEKHDGAKTVRYEERSVGHKSMIRFAIPWIPGLDSFLGKKDSLARTQQYCLEVLARSPSPSAAAAASANASTGGVADFRVGSTSATLPAEDCFFSTPSFVVSEDFDAWRAMHDRLSARYGRPAPWIIKPSDGFYSSGIFFVSKTALPKFATLQKRKEEPDARTRGEEDDDREDDEGEDDEGEGELHDEHAEHDEYAEHAEEQQAQEYEFVQGDLFGEVEDADADEDENNGVEEEDHRNDDIDWEGGQEEEGQRQRLRHLLDSSSDAHVPMLVAQEYVHDPLTWRGRKFDFRFMAVVTSLSPLRVYIQRFGFIKTGVAPYADDLVRMEHELVKPNSLEVCKHITTATATCMHYARTHPREMYKGSKFGATLAEFTRGAPLYTDEDRFVQGVQWRKGAAKAAGDELVANVTAGDDEVGDGARLRIKEGKEELWRRAWQSCRRAALDAVKIAVLKMRDTPIDEEEAQLRKTLSRLRQFGVLGFDGIVDASGRCYVEEVNLNGAIVEHKRLPRILDIVKDEIRISGKHNEDRVDVFHRIRPYKFMDALTQFCQDRRRHAEGLGVRFVHPGYAPYLPRSTCTEEDTEAYLSLYDEATSGVKGFRYAGVITPSMQRAIEGDEMAGTIAAQRMAHLMETMPESVAESIFVIYLSTEGLLDFA